MAAFERGQRGFQGIARGIAGTRVVPAAVGADAGELEGGRQVQGNVDGARLRIGLLACMYGKGRVAIVSHVGVLWEAPAFQNIAAGWGGCSAGLLTGCRAGLQTRTCYRAATLFPSKCASISSSVLPLVSGRKNAAMMK